MNDYSQNSDGNTEKLNSIWNIDIGPLYPSVHDKCLSVLLDLFPLNFTKAKDFFDMTQEQQKAQFKLLNSYFLQNLPNMEMDTMFFDKE